MIFLNDVINESFDMSDRIREKLQILADAAKYDVSCSSSGSDRKTKIKVWGCQSFGYLP